jgi:hypothetical protein
MSGISLHMQWPLTSQLHGSFLKENKCFFSLWIKLHAEVGLTTYFFKLPRPGWGANPEFLFFIYLLNIIFFTSVINSAWVVTGREVELG